MRILSSCYILRHNWQNITSSGGSRGTSNNCIGEQNSLRQFLLSYKGVRRTLSLPLSHLNNIVLISFNVLIRLWRLLLVQATRPNLKSDPTPGYTDAVTLHDSTQCRICYNPVTAQKMFCGKNYRISCRPLYSTLALITPSTKILP